MVCNLFLHFIMTAGCTNKLISPPYMSHSLGRENLLSVIAEKTRKVCRKVDLPRSLRKHNANMVFGIKLVFPAKAPLSKWVEWVGERPFRYQCDFDLLFFSERLDRVIQLYLWEILPNLQDPLPPNRYRRALPTNVSRFHRSKEKRKLRSFLCTCSENPIRKSHWLVLQNGRQGRRDPGGQTDRVPQREAAGSAAERDPVPALQRAESQRDYQRVRRGPGEGQPR